jgi:Flp pilus assembly protein TadB
MIRRTNWGGSIATFIVVAAILIGGMVGAAYILNQRAKQARTTEQIATTSNDKKAGDKKPSSNGTNTESNKSTTTNTNQPSNQTPNTLSQSGYLPQTGLDLPLTQILAVFFLSSLTVAYVTSRRSSLT